MHNRRLRALQLSSTSNQSREAGGGIGGEELTGGKVTYKVAEQWRGNCNGEGGTTHNQTRPDRTKPFLLNNLWQILTTCTSTKTAKTGIILFWSPVIFSRPKLSIGTSCPSHVGIVKSMFAIIIMYQGQKLFVLGQNNWSKIWHDRSSNSDSFKKLI